ncbi:response regulator transcription factor [Dactylosporangium sp. NPDC000555]|uniref:response regulator transcription factor n=1 Tax=Dactylosporangium sp. NPDC000555 TaxID=3154260 RepID=UPI0033253C48
MQNNVNRSVRPVRVVVCESEPLVREGLKSSLREANVEVVAEVETSSQLMHESVRHEFDVVLMGVAQPFPERTDLAAMASRLRCQFVVMLRASDQEAFIPFVQSGIRGFVASQTAPADVSHAVRSVARNEAYLSPVLARQLLDWLADRLSQPTRQPDVPTAKLSEREQEVLALLGVGASNAEISRKLRIQETTVRSHVYHILTKLNLRSRTEAVLYGFQTGLRQAGENGLRQAG